MAGWELDNARGVWQQRTAADAEDLPSWFLLGNAHLAADRDLAVDISEGDPVLVSGSEEALAILKAERLRRDRQVGLGEFVRGLRQGQ